MSCDGQAGSLSPDETDSGTRRPRLPVNVVKKGQRRTEEFDACLLPSMHLSASPCLEHHSLASTGQIHVHPLSTNTSADANHTVFPLQSCRGQPCIRGWDRRSVYSVLLLLCSLCLPLISLWAFAGWSLHHQSTVSVTDKRRHELAPLSFPSKLFFLRLLPLPSDEGET